jgi:hypothetical protein
MAPALADRAGTLKALAVTLRAKPPERFLSELLKAGALKVAPVHAYLSARLASGAALTAAINANACRAVIGQLLRERRRNADLVGRGVLTRNIRAPRIVAGNVDTCIAGTAV